MYNDEFFINKSNETWMDHLSREGICVEWQAFKLLILSMLDKKKENSFKPKVHKALWNSLYLKDRENDPTLRPNLFIAYYIYPDLLRKDEWLACFDYAIKKLWLQWGGLSTIDKTSSYFIPEHTGENSLSYHSGDSWFWINNLAAIAMLRLDKNKYLYHILKILEASSNEILWMGALGHSSELSSASDLKSQGCLMQAWSAAMFIELVSELANEKLI